MRIRELGTLVITNVINSFAFHWLADISIPQTSFHSRYTWKFAGKKDQKLVVISKLYLVFFPRQKCFADRLRFNLGDLGVASWTAAKRLNGREKKAGEEKSRRRGIEECFNGPAPNGRSSFGVFSIMPRIPEISVGIQMERSVPVSYDQNIRYHLWRWST